MHEATPLCCKRCAHVRGYAAESGGSSCVCGRGFLCLPRCGAPPRAYPHCARMHAVAASARRTSR